MRRERGKTFRQSQRQVIFSVTLFLKLSLALAMILFLSIGVTATLLESGLRTVFGSIFSQKTLFLRLIRTMQIMGFGGAGVMLLSFIFAYMRGLTQYQRLYERIARTAQLDVSYQNPWLVSFPSEDIFGNLGAVLNQYIRQLARFDKLKTSALQRLQERFEYVADFCPIPILLLFLKKSFPYPSVVISYANKAFLEIFAKKGKDDYYEVQGLSFDIHEANKEKHTSVGKLFESMYEAEIAESLFLTDEMQYKVNEVIAHLEPAFLSEQKITPLHESEENPRPIICREIEFYPFFDVVMEEGNEPQRKVREVLVLFKNVQVPRDKSPMDTLLRIWKTLIPLKTEEKKDQKA
ncbi:hypothetical protein [Thermospira aquatica]|uniref:HAMP domain-containing protein n=1 Tax=Thermospira aquatica TaxID=2828656 RepID=A0AAX3BEC2_9SPIR|nr:hypothetical protein [Thermospira aquatica]URA10652.1 hypothetical protein KDW03_02270 [Thermospira aquatica]